LGHFYVLLGVLVLVAALAAWRLLQIVRRRRRLPYVADPVLFSLEQRRFLEVLERAVGKGYRIYGMVRVADVVGLRPKLDRESRQRAYERLGDRRFDFLVCTHSNSAIACAVNLAPRSRLRSRAPRDALDRICEAAGLPFVRFREGDVYSVLEIEERVFGAMHAVRVAAEDPEPHKEETQAALAELAQAMSDEAEVPKSPTRSLRAWTSRGRNGDSAPRGAPSSLKAGDARGRDAPMPWRSDPVLGSDEHLHPADEEGPVLGITTELEQHLREERRTAQIGRI
jgi:hypothetical protein